MQSQRKTRKQDIANPDAHDNVRPIIVKDGVLILTGHGLRVVVERGQLLVADGIGSDRRCGLLSRATCRLKRMVVLGHSGTISFDALRWLHDVGAAFIQIDADGTLIAATGAIGLDQPKLRRAQALAGTNDVGLTLTRQLLAQKLAGQLALIDQFPDTDAACDVIARTIADLADTDDLLTLRNLEARAANVYWNCWSSVAVSFAKRDNEHIPPHWQTFGVRSSPLTGSPRLAANPINALLNYFYALLEAETRIACLTMGLDPGIGILHHDQTSRDSLVLDLLEPTRPKVDALVLRLLRHRTFALRDFFETRQGNCRLMPSVTAPLGDFCPQLGQWVAPVVEDCARSLLQSVSPVKSQTLPTLLTQSNRSAGRDKVRTHEPKLSINSLPLARSCQGCGMTLLDSDKTWCSTCYSRFRADKDRANIVKALATKAKMRADGHDPAHGNDAARKRGSTNRTQQQLNRAWEATQEPAMSEISFRELVLPGLQTLSLTELMAKLGISKGYAAKVKKGERLPHPRHWKAIEALISESPTAAESRKVSLD